MSSNVDTSDVINIVERLSRLVLTTQRMHEAGFPMRDPENQTRFAVLITPEKRSYENVTQGSRFCVRCCTELDKGPYWSFGGFCHGHRDKFIDNRYNCCGSSERCDWCTVHESHVWSGLYTGTNGPFYDFTEFPKKENQLPVVGLDCEMVFTAGGMEVARITLVDVHGKRIYDTLVRPQTRVLDFCTLITGITGHKMTYAKKTLNEVKEEMAAFIGPDTILVGHGLENDLRVLRAVHTRVVDTALIYESSRGKKFRPSLRDLARNHLDRIIQASNMGHCSEEDARAAVDLAKKKALID